jgi:hypothetical protein
MLERMLGEVVGDERLELVTQMVICNNISDLQTFTSAIYTHPCTQISQLIG